MPFSDYLYSDELNDYVRNSVQPGLSDIIGDSSTMMKLLLNQGRTDALDQHKATAGMMWAAGPKVEKTIRIDLLDSVGWHQDYQVFDPSPNRVTTSAQMRWARARAHIVWTKDDDLAVRAGGTGELKTVICLNRLRDKYNEAYAALADMMGDALYGYVDTVPEPYGLGLLAGRYVAGSYGGIDRSWMGIDSTNLAAWDSYRDAVEHPAADLVDPASTSYLPTVIDDLIYSTSFGGFGLSNIVMNQAEYRVFENILRDKRVIGDAQVGDLGYEYIKHKGKTIAWDSKMPDHHCYGLNLAAVFGGKPCLYIVGREGGWYDETEWQGSQNTLELVKHITVNYNLWCDNPRFQGAITRLGE